MTLIDETDLLHGKYVRGDRADHGGAVTDDERTALIESIDSLRQSAERIGATNPRGDLQWLWRGKAIAYETVLGMLRVREAKCDHKFISSDHCVKCGWTPTPEDFKRAAGGLTTGAL